MKNPVVRVKNSGKIIGQPVSASTVWGQNFPRIFHAPDRDFSRPRPSPLPEFFTRPTVPFARIFHTPDRPLCQNFSHPRPSPLPESFTPPTAPEARIFHTEFTPLTNPWARISYPPDRPLGQNLGCHPEADPRIHHLARSLLDLFILIVWVPWTSRCRAYMSTRCT